MSQEASDQLSENDLRQQAEAAFGGHVLPPHLQQLRDDILALPIDEAYRNERDFQGEQEPQIVFFGLRRVSRKWMIVAMALAHAAWDLFLSVSSIYFLSRMPKDSHRYNTVEKPMLIQALLTIYAPAALMKLIHLLQCRGRSAMVFKERYWKIVIVQMLFYNVLFVLQLAYYKSFLVNISMVDSMSDNFTKRVSLLMTLDVILMHIWSLFEAIQYSIYWCKGGYVSLSRHEQMERLVDYAGKFRSQKFSEHAECPICLGTFVENESKILVMPCDVRHYFHVECIQHWIESNHDSCPLCKRNFTLPEVMKFNQKIDSHLKTASLPNSQDIEMVPVSTTDQSFESSASSEDLDIFVSS